MGTTEHEEPRFFFILNKGAKSGGEITHAVLNGSIVSKPAGWDASAVPSRVAASTDLVVYELHVRDFSANDNSVSAANRGKYLAFTEATSNGMKHLAALAQAGFAATRDEHGWSIGPAAVGASDE